MIADPTADFCYLRLQTTQSEEEHGFDAPTLKTWSRHLHDLAAGHAAEDLPLLCEPPPVVPRDVFAYAIAGAKERNPAAAMALIAALGD